MVGSRHVTSPPGSTSARIKAWETRFSNLVITGDWIYTGLNVGNVEGAVMGGRLASYAVSGHPALANIVGYPKGCFLIRSACGHRINWVFCYRKMTISETNRARMSQ